MGGHAAGEPRQGAVSALLKIVVLGVALFKQRLSSPMVVCSTCAASTAQGVQATETNMRGSESQLGCLWLMAC